MEEKKAAKIGDFFDECVPRCSSKYMPNIRNKNVPNAAEPACY
ncbi:hypothetical protein [Paenibacillus sp. ISL-20]|nr:hypothetical protein [Paenibacillus sp. ISL-20]